MRKNLFITGALGQDGSILNNLLKKNKNLKLINVLGIKNKSQKIPNAYYVDLQKKKQIDRLFSNVKPDVVLHLGSKNPSYSESSYNKFFKYNLISTKNLFFSTFENNKNAKFIFCNSSQIFKKKYGIVNEKSKFSVNSDYTRFRINAHHEMLKYKIKNNIKYTNVILFNHDSKYRNKKFILPRIMIGIKNKKNDFIQEIINQNISADFSHAEDICNGLGRIILSNKNLDNIILSSGRATKLNDILKYILKNNKITHNFNFKTKRKTKCLIGKNKFAISQINWKPKKNIFIAADEMLKFYLKNGK